MSTSETNQAPRTLEGYEPSIKTREELHDAIEKAFDYRGDVTLALECGSIVEGYVFDRKVCASMAESHLKLYPKGSEEQMRVTYSSIVAIRFSGKDTASGKSWETWLRKYAEQKAKGEKVGIESESLDD